MEAVPMIASGLFAGAALSVSIAEHPARQDIDPEQAVRQFKKSYKQIAPLQVDRSSSINITCFKLLTLQYSMFLY